MSKESILILVLFILGFYGCSTEVENPAIAEGVPSKPQLSAPANQSVCVSVTPRFDWADISNASVYKLEVASDTTFNNIVFSQDSIKSNYKIVAGLSAGTNYFWRVSAKNSIGWSVPSTIFLFSTMASAATGESCPGIATIADSRNGKVYNTVMIGTQCWMRENLNVGTDKMCYGNNSQNCDLYGGLYYSADVNKSTYQAICPAGWHLPSKEEFQFLADAAGNTNALKAVGQGTGNGQGTNTSGFSALLSGYLTYPGSYKDMGEMAGFWTSTTQNGSQPDVFAVIYYNDGNIYFSPSGTTEYAVSVRCIKD